MSLDLWYGTGDDPGESDGRLPAGVRFIAADADGNVYVNADVTGPDRLIVLKLNASAEPLGVLWTDTVSGGAYSLTFYLATVGNELYRGKEVLASGHYSSELYDDDGHVAGSWDAAYAIVEGTGGAASLGLVTDVYGSADGNVYVLSYEGGSGTASRILKVTPAGVVTNDYAHTTILLQYLAVGPDGVAYVPAINPDTGGPCILAFEPDGDVSVHVALDSSTVDCPSGHVVGVTDLDITPDGTLILLATTSPPGSPGQATGRLLSVPFGDGEITTHATWDQDIASGGYVGAPKGIALDHEGGVLILFGRAGGGQHGSLSYTIQRVDGVFEVVAPADAMLSTLTDGFGSINDAKWDTTGPVGSANGAVELGTSVVRGYLTSVDAYDFDSAEVQIRAPGYGMALWVDDADGDEYVRIVIEPGETWHVRAEWFIGGTSGSSGDGLPFDYDAHRRLRIKRVGATVEFAVSQDGLTWDNIYTQALGTTKLRNVRAILYGQWATALDNFNIEATPPEEPPDPEEPITIPDPFDPEAPAPPKANNKCKTLLELIREFSAAVKRPVRIVGPGVIEMVDINAPLPTGWTVSDADDLYTDTTHEVSAGEKTLSLDKGLLVLNASASLVTNDVRLIVSDWQLPHMLPVYGLSTALVRRIEYTFTPKTFRGSVEFHMRPVPYALRRD